METLSKTLGADTTQRKELCPPPAAPSGVVSDSLSLPSYKDYPSHRPSIHTHLYHAHQTRSRQSCPPSSPTKAFPETSSAEILSALRNLQKKIRMLELEKGHVKRSLHTAGKDASHTRLQTDDVTRNLSKDPADPERGTSARSNCNQVLITHLAAAESRCVKLERQLDHVRRMLRGAEADRAGPPKPQVSVETTRSAGQQRDAVFERAQSEKLERLEREHLRLTRTQNNAEMKILELEMKLQEEEHQRKLVNHKANQLQTGLETNRMLLQAVSPLLSSRRRQEKTSCSKKPSPQPSSSYTEPHYRLSLGDVPFVAGTSVGCSHSVRANVQSVLSLLKRHQPRLCNRRVLNAESRETGRHGRSDGGSSSSSSSSSSPAASVEDLSELLRTLQEEQRLMSSSGAGRAEEAAGGRRVRPGEKRTSEGGGEAAAEDGEERRTD
ncbi:centrosomal protein of 57 kDa isoform X2 [Pseudoliparis swirei]|uniref:centrosomal protein of 57 kDa isoform X2 n=1 Tax=Pseudoliparis swirei TaxID=2059687 RepID=UPI0024BE9C7D|nr:centrosomal protein of 57 kDa isoform X2 [Pseudoliparis swirei]